MLLDSDPRYPSLKRQEVIKKDIEVLLERKQVAFVNRKDINEYANILGG